MSQQGQYLVLQSVNDSVALLAELERSKTLAQRISQRMVAIGVGALQDYVWPTGYTQADFVALYNALAALPGMVVDDATRDKIFKLVSSIV